jgi:UbiA prenyltransferase family
MSAPSLKAYLSLVRIPTVFSSMSNAYAGWFIAGGEGFGPALWLGVAAAACFIMAGMALNDIADKDVDAKERPNRPIPSGAIGLGVAWTLSLAFMGIGLSLQWLANPISAFVGAALCAAIFLYNFALKATWIGPASMGLCRLLNLLAGMSLAWDRWPSWSALPAAVPGSLFALWAYIALVTYLARDEVGGNSRLRARVFLGGITSWFTAWSFAIWLGMGPGQSLRVLAMGVAWTLHVCLLLAPFRALSRDPSPRNTGKTVGALLRTVPLADVLAMLAAGAPLIAALPGVLWILPAWVVGKLFYST